MGNADLHIHTRHGDGMATVAEVLGHVEAHTDLDVIAITEHDTMRASDEARDRSARGSFRFEVVPGMEVTTLDGHLLALFVETSVPSFRRIEETLTAIHVQGGLAVVPHPLSWLTRSVNEKTFARVAAASDPAVRFDAIEEYNGSPAGRTTSAKARRLNASKPQSRGCRFQRRSLPAVDRQRPHDVRGLQRHVICVLLLRPGRRRACWAVRRGRPNWATGTSRSSSGAA